MADSDRYHESVCGRYVMLNGGLSLPLAPLQLVLELERRGFQLSRDGDDILVYPVSRLTADDTRQLRQWKRHVLAVLDYQPEAIQ